MFAEDETQVSPESDGCVGVITVKLLLCVVKEPTEGMALPWGPLLRVVFRSSRPTRPGWRQGLGTLAAPQGPPGGGIGGD